MASKKRGDRTSSAPKHVRVVEDGEDYVAIVRVNFRAASSDDASDRIEEIKDMIASEHDVTDANVNNLRRDSGDSEEESADDDIDIEEHE